jgi:hypothetical protein
VDSQTRLRRVISMVDILLRTSPSDLATRASPRQVALAYQRIMRGDKSSIGRSAASLNRNKDSGPIETGRP